MDFEAILARISDKDVLIDVNYKDGSSEVYCRNAEGKWLVNVWGNMVHMTSRMLAQEIASKDEEVDFII